VEGIANERPERLGAARVLRVVLIGAESTGRRAYMLGLANDAER
jgi:enoyl-CoA hydratase/carnithine racemase